MSAATNERAEQAWLYCATHDIRFKSRSAESLRHSEFNGCEIVRDDASEVKP